MVTALVALSGCATNHYGRVDALTVDDKRDLSCPEIDIETARVDAFQQQVAKQSQHDRRSMLSAATGFGIGNAMNRDAAIKSANQRRHQLDDLRVEKRCDDAPLAPPAMPEPDMPPSSD